MYICICRAVTDADIRHAAEEGKAGSLRDLAACLGVGTQCGRCACCARNLLRGIQAESAARGSLADAA